MINQLKKTLENIGLKLKEITVLLVLFQNGSMYPASIAKSTGLNRTTTYGILKILASKGLVSSVKKDGVIKYQSIQPNLFPQYIERKRESLHEDERRVKELLPQLNLLREKSLTLPKIQFFEGDEGVKQAYEDTLENNKGKTLHDLTGTDAVFRKMGKEWIEYYLKKRTSLGIKCFDIAPDSEWSKITKSEDKKYLRETKLIPAEFSFDTEIDIYDNKVAIFSFSKENPIAVIIEDENIAHTMKTLFRFIDQSI